MNQLPTAFIHSPDIDRYHYPPECPFKTERAAMTRSLLQSMSCFAGPGKIEVAPRPAEHEELILFHTPEYLGILKKAAGGSIDASSLSAGLGTPETPVFRDLFTYAELAAGATLTGADIETDLYIGLGGTFLGSSESAAGLRDMRVYSQGEERNAIVRDVSGAVEYIKANVFPVHGI